MSRNQSYQVNLPTDEREHLENLVSSGVGKARILMRARILLKSDEGLTDHEVMGALGVGHSTVGRVRKNYSQEGLEGALHQKVPKREYPRKLTESDEDHLIALVCSEPPDGYTSWSLRLLSEHLVALEQVEIESISHEAVRRALKRTNLNPDRMFIG